MRKIIILLMCSMISFQVFALANPASVNCESKGNKMIFFKSLGFCLFSDNTYCEEWAYYKNNCQPGRNTLPNGFDATQLNNYCVVKDSINPRFEICQE